MGIQRSTAWSLASEHNRKGALSPQSSSRTVGGVVAPPLIPVWRSARHRLLFKQHALIEQKLIQQSDVIMAKTTLRLVVPTTERLKNADLRTREHLTPDEAELLVEAAKRNRHGQRDGLMVLLAYRHGLRAAEVVDPRWEQVDFKTASLHVRRVKNGTPSTHPLRP
jgi:integrase